MSVQRKQRLIHAVEMLAGVTVLCAGITLPNYNNFSVFRCSKFSNSMNIFVVFTFIN